MGRVGRWLTRDFLEIGFIERWLFMLPIGALPSFNMFYFHGTWLGFLSLGMGCSLMTAMASIPYWDEKRAKVAAAGAIVLGTISAILWVTTV